jgi:hypothetical protein
MENSEQKIFIINKFEYGEDRDTYESTEYLKNVFDSYDEFYHFWSSLAEAHPDGVPEEYINQKLKQHSLFKLIDTLEDLEGQGLVYRTQNEDGEDVWSINPLRTI